MATQGEECLTACTIYHNMGGILFSKGDFAAAKPYGEKAWELSQRLLGESDPRTMADAAAFAAILDGLGRYERGNLPSRACGVGRVLWARPLCSCCKSAKPCSR